MNHSINVIILLLAMATIPPGCDQNAERSTAQVSATAAVIVPQWDEPLFAKSVDAGKPALVEFGGNCASRQQMQPLLQNFPNNTPINCWWPMSKSMKK
jgi:hypothetical protein